jgi:iron complex outermembrane receptor protein
MLLVGGLLVAGEARAARGQDGVIRGRVTDSAGVAIPEADVAIVAIHALTRSDAQGRFSFSNVARGEHELSVRRLGYQPTTVKAIVGDLAYSYDIVLVAQAASVEGVDVNADLRLRLGIEEFYRRRARGAGGTFFTREEIAQRNPRRTTDLLRSAPGLRIVSGRNGTGARFNGKRQCAPTLWLDGQAVRDMELDNIPVTDIEGMEIYSGPSTTPMQFSQASSHTDCGAIVVWTRIPGEP